MRQTLRPYPRTALGLVGLALTVACSADPDSKIFDGEAGGAAGFVAVGAGDPGTGGVGGLGCIDCGGGGEAPIEPTGPEVCYPGPGEDYTACVPLISHDESWGADYAYPDKDDPRYLKPLRFIDLAAVDASFPIAEFFDIEEVMQEYKGRYGIYQSHVVGKLQQIREQIGGALHVNSGYRSPAYNASVGGVTYSRHMYGDAADMWSNAVSLTQLGNICDQLGAGYVGLYESFVHCDWRDDPLDPAFYGSIDEDDVESIAVPEHSGQLERVAAGSVWRAPATGFDEGEPLRIWSAYDADGQVIDEAEGRSYEPPVDAVRLHVRVGGQLDFEANL